MRNYSKIIGALAAASALAAGNASAQVTGEVHTGYTSEYIFRGANQGTDLIEAGADVAYEIAPAALTLSAGAWYGSFNAPVGIGNFDKDFDELDLYGKVSKDFGPITAAVGFIYYDYDQGDLNQIITGKVSNTSEAFVSLSHDFGFVNASLTYFQDVKGDNDGYTELALSKAFELNGCLTLNTSAALGYIAEEGHLAHLTTKVSLDYAFAEHAKLSPFAALSIDLSGGNGIAYQQAKNELVGGALISVGF